MEGRERTLNDWLVAIEGSEGLKSCVCDTMDCTYMTFNDMLDANPILAESLELVKERTYDEVEAKLLKHIWNGSISVAIFYAKTKMKHRGFVERIEQHVEQTNNRTIVVLPAKDVSSYGETKTTPKTSTKNKTIESGKTDPSTED